jgi:hypothetical protein
MAEIWEIEEREPTELELKYAKAHKDMIERVARYDERLLTVIKNHLSCEEALNQLLGAASRSWKKKKFSGKLDVGRDQIKPNEMTAHLWEVVKVGNLLRNAVAHGHPESVIAARMVELRTAYLGAVSPQQRPGIEAMTEVQMVGSAFNHCGSHIIVAADRIERERG